MSIQSSIVNEWTKPLIPQVKDDPSSLTESFKALSVENKKNHPSVQLKLGTLIKNVHQDDIHGLIRGNSGQFISGSKDGCIKLWEGKGSLSKIVLDKQKINYVEWITALTPFGKEGFISGTRDGKVELWSFTGKHISTLDAPSGLKSTSSTSKERNHNRINCLFADTTSDVFYVGRPCHFTIHSYKDGKCLDLGSCSTSKNDWVYCIHKLATDKLLVVTGDMLDLWVNDEKTWNKTSFIAPKTERGETRPFISSLTPLTHDTKNSFGLSLFDGSVSCINIEANKVFFNATEHKKRVWTIENLMPQVFASCGDDHTIKIWDIRASEKSQITLKKNVGRVSVLLHLENNTLVSGSCPDDVRQSTDKAEFTFWNIKKF